MKTRFSLLLTALCGFVTLVSLHAQNSAFTYQGRLTSGGNPASGSHDFQFMLFDAASGAGSGLIAGPVTNAAVLVSNGLFQVMLDFQSSLVALTTGGFTGEDRWLDIAVRPAGSGVFTPLMPRQRITPVPYAVTALNALTAMSVPGIDGYSLRSSDGSIANALFVDGGGEVGIGTTLPAARLHVVAAPDDVVPPRLESTGNNRFSAGWDFYHNGVGKGYVGVPDANAGIAPGELALFGGPGVKASLWGGQVRALTTDTAGNVQVSGDVKLGASGQFRAASGEESLRLVRGLVDGDGTILRGSGFTVTRAGDGDYRITFATPFSAPPVITASQEFTASFPLHVSAYDVTANSAKVIAQFNSQSTGFPRVDGSFHFIAIGPR